jgi:hypothetical protein
MKSINPFNLGSSRVDSKVEWRVGARVE